MSSQQKRNSFFGSAAILTMGIVAVKIIGAIYKIPLGNVLTEEAYGDFNAAYNIYNFFLTISTAGLPVALSKTVSEANALDRRNQAGRTFRVAFCAFLFMGIFSFLCMSLFGQAVATHVINNEKAVYCVVALSPAVLCTCCCSAFRGYAQGHMNMVPTAISQIIEALSKLFIGLALAGIILRMSIQPKDLGDRLVAAGAIAGVSAGSILSVTYLSFQHFHRQRHRSAASDKADPPREILIRLLKLAIPITLSSCSMSIVTLLDTNLVNGQLQTVFRGIQDGIYQVSNSLFGIFEKASALFQSNLQAMLADPSAEIDPVLDSARKLYGIYGLSMNIYNLPFSMMIPLTACIVPAVSGSLARRDRLGAVRISESALRMAALIAFPAGAGLFALGGPIMGLLYPNTDLSIAGPLLSILGLASIAVCFQLVGTSILQAYGIVNLPIITVIIGGIVKLIVNYTLVGKPEVMIIGAPVGTLSCFIVVSTMNLFIIKRVVPHPPKYTKVFFKPFLASALMGGAAWASHGLLDQALRALPTFWKTSQETGQVYFSYLGSALGTVLSIGIGGIVYLILVLFLRIISREDLELMPKGDKIAKLLHIQ